MELIMRHTQGKWVAHQIEETGEFAIFSLNTFIAQTENPMINEEPTKSEKQANANLIASAPEMLKSLKLILDECRAVTVTGFHNKLMNIWEMAEKAIAKAEGE